MDVPDHENGRGGPSVHGYVLRARVHENVEGRANANAWLKRGSALEKSGRQPIVIGLPDILEGCHLGHVVQGKSTGNNNQILK